MPFFFRSNFSYSFKSKSSHYFRSGFPRHLKSSVLSVICATLLAGQFVSPTYSVFAAENYTITEDAEPNSEPREDTKSNVEPGTMPDPISKTIPESIPNDVLEPDLPTNSSRSVDATKLSDQLTNTSRPVNDAGFQSVNDTEFVHNSSGSINDVGFIQQTLIKTIGQYEISANGYMPKGAELSVAQLSNINELEKVIGNEDYTIYAAFDIKIIAGGEVWQPVDDGETVTITATNIEIPAGEEIKVYRVENEAFESVNVPEEAIVELNAIETIDSDIEVETEHFTTYTFGGVSYNSVETGTWLGMTYETYDTDGDGTAETLVISGTQTQTVTTSSKNSTSANYFKKSPYYNNKITNIMFKEGSNLTNGYRLFYKCTNLTSINITNANTANVTDMSDMFRSCSALTSLDLSDFNTAKVTDMNSMFDSCETLTSLDISHFNTSSATDMQFMFSGCTKLANLNFGDNFDTSNVTNMEAMFQSCSALEALDLGDNFDTSNVTAMDHMFHNCFTLKALDLGDKCNTSNVTNMSAMFNSCENLTSLDISHFNTSNATDMQFMFSGCTKLANLNFGDNFDTSNVTNMKAMFQSCSALKALDLGDKFNTSNVTDMNHMFHKCSTLKALDLGDKFNTSNVTDMGSMFNYCHALPSIDITHFNTTKVTTMANMFNQCKALTSLDVSSFDTSSVTNMHAMFGECISLTELDFSNFDMSKVTDANVMLDMVSTTVPDQTHQLAKIVAPANIPDTLELTLPTISSNYEWYLDGDKHSAMTKIITSAIEPHTYEKKLKDSYFVSVPAQILLNHDYYLDQNGKKYICQDSTANTKFGSGDIQIYGVTSLPLQITINASTMNSGANNAQLYLIDATTLSEMPATVTNIPKQNKTTHLATTINPFTRDITEPINYPIIMVADFTQTGTYAGNLQLTFGLH